MNVKKSIENIKAITGAPDSFIAKHVGVNAMTIFNARNGVREPVLATAIKIFKMEEITKEYAKKLEALTKQ